MVEGRGAGEHDDIERVHDGEQPNIVVAAAHDLRAYLAAVLGVIETLRTYGGQLDEETRNELLDGAAGEARGLFRLIEDLLTVSRMQSDRGRPDVRDVEVGELVQDALRAAGTTGATKVEVGSEQIRCDRGLVVSALTNLLDDSAKHTPPGSPIEVRVEPTADGVCFSVSELPGASLEERGCGLPPRREDASGRRSAGLQLSIARGLVRTLGGRLSVEESPWGGAVLSFTIPVVDKGDPDGDRGPDAPDVAR